MWSTSPRYLENEMKFTATHVVIIAVAMTAALTVLVSLNKLPASVLSAPAAWFFGWLMRSPISPPEMPVILATPVSEQHQ